VEVREEPLEDILVQEKAYMPKVRKQETPISNLAN
jgi:hypothetical protein